MNKSLKLMGCIAASGVLFSSACKKKTDAVEEAKKNIVASWQLSQGILDSNNNAVKDPHEYVTFDSSESNIITFKSDGTGDIEGVPLAWKMIDANRFIFSVVSASSNPDTLNATIISASRFDVLTPQLPGEYNIWYVFKKL